MKIKSLLTVIFLISSLSAYPGRLQELRVAIIGAGISGLTAGHYLRKEGFKNVTIFEKEAEIGGKVLSKNFEGSIYDLGAVWVFKEYKTILEMAGELNLPLKRFSERKTILADGNRLLFLNYGLQRFTFFEILDELIRAKKVLAKYSYLKNPGYGKVTPELIESFEDFAQKNNLDSIKFIMEPFLVGTGYGYSTDVPAIYILKPTVLVFDSLVEDFINEYFGIPSNAFSYFSEGFQMFLKEMAKDLKVKTGEEVLKVTRENNKINIYTNRGDYTFDKVIVATPPDATMKFLDTTEEEAFLFSQMQSNFYQATAFKGEGLPKNEVIFFSKAIDETNRGTPAVLANWGRKNNIWIAHTPYNLEKGYIPVDILMDKLDEEINFLGGKPGNILFTRGLSYFFHFSGDFLRKYAPYEKLESMQGNLGTYYIGGHLNFESVEHAAQYAKEVVNRYLIH